MTCPFFRVIFIAKLLTDNVFALFCIKFYQKVAGKLTEVSDRPNFTFTATGVN